MDFDTIVPDAPWDFSGFRRLLDAVDGKCAAQERELAGQIACKAGCHHCCRRIPTILPIEWAWIRDSEQQSRSMESAHPSRRSPTETSSGRADSEVAPSHAVRPFDRAQDRPEEDQRSVSKGERRILSSDLHPCEPLCGHLDAQGLCRIYAARPLICRTHGMLILSDDGLDHCPWNFQDLEEVDEDLPFRLENLHGTLLRLNLAFLRRSYPSRWRELAGIRVAFQS